MSTVDVILPVKGRCNWIKAALDSIKNQTREPDIVTIIDDGITDAEGIEEYASKLFGQRCRILSNRGQGLSDALNTGVEASRCDWIARMDADDVSTPDRLKKQLAFLSSEGNQALLGCGTQAELINEEGRTIGYSRNPESWENILSGFVKRCCFVHSTLVVKRKYLLEVPYRRVFDGAEDIDLILRLSECGKIVNMSSILLKYRLHHAQSSFAKRSRQVALQELAVRLHYIRRSGRDDPVDKKPSLVEDFIEWRLGQKSYDRTRKLLTILRYASTYFRGGDYRSTALLLKRLPESIDLSVNTFRIVYKVITGSGTVFAYERTPFPELNITS
jgi:glycosyltransferase involved in cell wall biosynthesis